MLSLSLLLNDLNPKNDAVFAAFLAITWRGVMTVTIIRRYFKFQKECEECEKDTNQLDQEDGRQILQSQSGHLIIFGHPLTVLSDSYISFGIVPCIRQSIFIQHHNSVETYHNIFF